MRPCDLDPVPSPIPSPAASSALGSPSGAGPAASSRVPAPTFILGLACGVLITAGLAIAVCGRAAGGRPAGDEAGIVAKRDPATVDAALSAGLVPGGLGGGGLGLLLAELAADPDAEASSGEFIFLPNRRTVWVIHRKSGRFANYQFRDNQEHTVFRSRVTTLNPADFPAEDTIFRLSDRNLSDVLWVCNKKTGDIQLWQPRPDGNVSLEGQIVTSIDLVK